MRRWLAASLCAVVVTTACSSSKTNQRTAPRAAIIAGAGAGTATPVPAARSAALEAAKSPTPLARTEDSAAKAMLLTLKDFPAGWTETPRDSSATRGLDACKPPATGQTGKAETGNFSSGTASISEAAGLFDTAALAAGYLDNLPAMGDCLVKAIDGGALDDSTATYTAATFSPLSFPQTGDASRAYRVKFHVRARGQTGGGSEADAYVDIVYAVKGRAAFALQSADAGSPFDINQLQQLTSQALAKLQQNTPAQ